MFRLILAVTLTVSLGATSASAQNSSIEDLMKAHVDALGGKHAIEKVENFQRLSRARGKAGGFPINGKMEEIVDLKNKRVRTALDLGTYKKQSVLTGDSGWTEDSQMGIKEMPENEVGLMKLNAGISPLLSLHAEDPDALIAGKQTEFNKKPCVEVSVQQTPIKFYIGNDSNLLEGFEVESLGVVTYENYKAVNGVKFATTITTSFDALGLKLVNEYTSTKFNVQIDDSTFGEEGKARDKSVEYTAEQVIGFLDKDGDERISKQEAKASTELSPAFDAVDTSNDGFIDLTEAEAMIQYTKNQKRSRKSAASFKKTTAKQIVASMDKNKDGKISKAEASAELRPFFNDTDTNNNGFVDEKEAQTLADFVNSNQ